MNTLARFTALRVSLGLCLCVGPTVWSIPAARGQKQRNSRQSPERMLSSPAPGVGGTPSLMALPICLQLVVHVGVSGMATAVTLEKCGHNKGYKGLDNCRFCPGSQCCVEDGPESIDSIIDMDAVCKRVTTLGLDVSVTISQDAGR